MSDLRATPLSAPRFADELNRLEIVSRLGPAVENEEDSAAPVAAREVTSILRSKVDAVVRIVGAFIIPPNPVLAIDSNCLPNSTPPAQSLEGNCYIFPDQWTQFFDRFWCQRAWCGQNSILECICGHLRWGHVL